VGSVVAIVVVCRVAREENISWLGWALIGVAVVLLTGFRWPYGALVGLITASAMPVFFVEVFGWKARPEHFVAAIVTVATVVWLAISKHRPVLNKLDYWIIAYVTINFISSAFESSAPSATLRWALQNSLAVLPYFLIRFLVRDLEALEKAFRFLLAVGVAEAAYAILCYVSHFVFGSTTGISIGQYFSGISAPYGSMYEPNLFGAYAGCCAVMLLSLYLLRGRNRSGYIACFLIASLASVLSFSRAALLALVIVISWVFWKARSAKSTGHHKLATVGLAASLMLVVAASPLGAILSERFNNLYYEGLTEETAVSRFIVVQQALQEIPDHTLLGSGTASFNLSFDWASYVPEWADVQTTWIGNTPLRILHDVGLLGLTAFLGFFVSVWLNIRKGLRSGSGQVPILVALWAGTLLYGISFQSTDGSILAFTWVHLGFLASASTIIMDVPKSEAPAVTMEQNSSWKF
jgi:O-antigen ligase